MRIPRGPGQSSGAKGAGEPKGTGKPQGNAFVSQLGIAASATDEVGRVNSAMMAELAQLAAELEAGKATKEEASRRFVGLVIRRKFGKQQGGGAEKMEEAVGDMIEDDPHFVSRLQSQLKRIARG